MAAKRRLLTDRVGIVTSNDDFFIELAGPVRYEVEGSDRRDRKPKVCYEPAK